MLAVFSVTSLADAHVAMAEDAPGTLRQAIFDANDAIGPDSIDFQNGLTGTLTLTAGELLIDDEVTIVGPGADLLTIDASGNDLVSPGTNDGSGTRVLNLDDGNINIAIAVEIRGLTLTGGDVSGDGGGIRSKESLTLTETIIVDNSALGVGIRGGGVFSEGGNLIVDRTTIDGNSATGSGANGGGIYSTTRLFGTQTTSITNSSLTGNTTSGDGGGLFSGNNLLEDQLTKIVNSTISGNAAGRGGGLFAFDGSNIVLHATITDNTSAADQGGGIASFGDIATNTEVHSSVVSGNSSGGDLAIVSGVENTFQSNGFNLIGNGNTFGLANQFSPLDNFAATGDQTGVLNPGLATLMDNGGPTLTHALLFSSPAVDAGDPNAQINVDDVPEFDQRGTPFGRIKNGNGIVRIDIGAFELPSIPGDYDRNGTVEQADYEIWKLHFGATSSPGLVADGNEDGVVDTVDYAVWLENLGATTPTAATSLSRAGEGLNSFSSVVGTTSEKPIGQAQAKGQRLVSSDERTIQPLTPRVDRSDLDYSPNEDDYLHDNLLLLAGRQHDNHHDDEADELIVDFQTRNTPAHESAIDQAFEDELLTRWPVFTA